MEVLIQIKNKVAIPLNSPVIICDNSDYQAVFLFDALWVAHPLKTARFRFARNGVESYVDVPFSGERVDIPAMRDVDWVQVGVYAGDLQTTTPAEIPCALSIRGGDFAPEEPEESVYDQIMQMIQEGAVRGEKGDKGDAYILTDVDKADIAAMVLAELPSGVRCNIPHVIKVTELPTENTDENAVYLCDGVYYRWVNEFTDLIVYDGEVLSFKEHLIQAGATISFNTIPTKTTKGVLVSDMNTIWHIYYIEDEANVFFYVDDWFALSDMGMTNGGVISNMNEVTTDGCYYALMTKGWWAYAYGTGTLDITKNGLYSVTGKENVAVGVPAVIIVQTVADLPADSTDGSIAFVLEGE